MGILEAWWKGTEFLSRVRVWLAKNVNVIYREAHGTCVYLSEGSECLSHADDILTLGCKLGQVVKHSCSADSNIMV